MTTREIKIATALLRALHDDGGQFDELSLHAKINEPLGLDVGASASELKAVIAICDSKKWVTGVPHKYTKRMLWNINDAGEAALLELTT